MRNVNTEKLYLIFERGEPQKYIYEQERRKPEVRIVFL